MKPGKPGRGPDEDGTFSGPQYAREKRRQRAAARSLGNLGVVWGPQSRPYADSPRLGCIGMIGITLILPIIIALAVLLSHYLP